jgi:hypothetical protein
MTGDQHVGSTLGLCPDEGVRLDEGGRYLPNKAQLWLWHHWMLFWDLVAEKVREHDALLYCLFNGDARDTVGAGHHGTTQIISANEEVQEYVTHRVFGVPRALKPVKSYVIRGTEVHVGPSGSSEEALARWFGAERDPVTESWSSWYRRISIYGRVIDATHHTTMGNIPWTEQNAANSLAAKVMMEYTRRRETPPDLVVRSHVHRSADSYDAYPTRALILPCWQLSTGFAYRVNANRLPDVGGAIAVIEPDGAMECKRTVYKPEPPPIEKVA